MRHRPSMSAKMLRVIIAMTPLTSACRSVSPAPRDEVSAAAPALHGLISAESFVIPRGTTVFVDGDVCIVAATVVRVEGSLIALNASDVGRNDAPNIEITCPLAIDIPGVVGGGEGRSPGAEPIPGGHGSKIVLTAPVVYIDGSVTSGKGGDGGSGAKGGAGGDALVNGYMLVRHTDGHSSLTGAAGGSGGYPGGEGGESGNALANVSDEVRARIDELQPRINAVLGLDHTARAGSP
jgi:hypothetical protein